MSAVITILLPWPPSLNTYWRNVVMGKGLKQSARVLISKEGREYRKSVEATCAHQAVAGTRLSGRLAVKLRVFPPDRRKRDLDNLPKSILDALTHAQVWEDDSQIDRLEIVRGEKTPNGSIIVQIQTHDEQKPRYEAA